MLSWRCECGGPLSCDESAFRFEPTDSLPGLWRYASSLPVADAARPVTLGEGMTPLSACVWDYGAGKVEIRCKFDALSPTGSYKDRGVAVQISRLKELGVTRLVEDSSGNAGASMAAYAAAAGIACDIYVPESASEGKCVQIAAYGANLKRIPGPREATTSAAEEAAGTVYYASHNWSPYFPQGIKTYAFEVFEQLGGVAPEAVIVPAGQGSLVAGAWRGFSEICRSGKASRPPRIYGVQSENCSPLYEAWKSGKSVPGPCVKKETMAEGIASAVPVRGAAVLEAARESDGGFVTATEKEIWESCERLFSLGFYVEPTSATALAGLEKLLRQGTIKPGENIVVLLSGFGLKATDKILHLRANPPR
jgi:threonine synthase